MIAPSRSPITLAYGAYGVAGYTKESPHAGTDFSHSPDNKIYAPEDAEVVFTGTLGTAGEAIDLAAGNRKHRMCHTSQILVSVGQKVKKGQVIGVMGQTGLAYGVHLHWVMWVNDARVNGMNYVNESGGQGVNMSEDFIKNMYRYVGGNDNPAQKDVDFHKSNSTPDSLMNGFIMNNDLATLRLRKQVDDFTRANKQLSDQITELRNQPPKEIIKEVVVEKPVQVSVPTTDLDSFSLGELLAAAFKKLFKVK